ncbi:MAG: hypothetical protein Fur0039_10920 [Rhodocyclaceae bacterium]
MRQQLAWSAGDYAVIGTTLQIVGESLCEALDLRAGERVLAEPIAPAERFNRAADGSLPAPSEYIEAVIECGG